MGLQDARRVPGKVQCYFCKQPREAKIKMNKEPKSIERILGKTDRGQLKGKNSYHNLLNLCNAQLREKNKNSHCLFLCKSRPAQLLPSCLSSFVSYGLDLGFLLALKKQAIGSLAIYGSDSRSEKVVNFAPSLRMPFGSMESFNTGRNIYCLFSQNLARYLKGFSNFIRNVAELETDIQNLKGSFLKPPPLS